MACRILVEASSTRSSLTIGLIFVVTLFQIYITSLTGPILDGFYTSISSQNSESFKSILWKSGVIALISACSNAFLQGVVGYLGWQFRNTFNTKFHPQYFTQARYHRMQAQVDNSDQRMTHDIMVWSNVCSSLIGDLIMAPCTIIYYSILIGLYINWYAPLIIYAWFILGYFANSFLIHYLSKLVAQRDTHEGNFRYNHAQVRNNAESLALSNGGPVELGISANLFDQVMEMRYRLIKWGTLLSLITNFFTYLISTLNYAIVAVPVLLKVKTFSSEAEISGYVAKVIFDATSLAAGLSLFLNLAHLFSDLIGFSNRLQTLIQHLNAPVATGSNLVIVPDRIEFQNVSFGPPNQPPIIENLSFVCGVGQNLLILGPSGSGKTSIQRVLSGLWEISSGTIYRPEQIYFLPAQPYFPRSGLSMQVTYPSADLISDEIILDLLGRVGLAYLFYQQLDTEASIHWTETLSTGERQRLTFARLIYHRPSFAVLDEATSALPVEVEASLYQQCQSITLISIGHRDSLRKFHSQIIELEGYSN